MNVDWSEVLWKGIPPLLGFIGILRGKQTNWRYVRWLWAAFEKRRHREFAVSSLERQRDYWKNTAYDLMEEIKMMKEMASFIESSGSYADQKNPTTIPDPPPSLTLTTPPELSKPKGISPSPKTSYEPNDGD